MNCLRCIALIVLIFLLGCSLWFLFNERKTSYTKNIEKDYDTFVTDLNLFQYDLNGKIHHELHTKKLTHYIQNDITLAEKPFFVFYPLGEPPWQIDALSGQSFDNNQSIVLTDKVRVEQLPGPNSHNIRLETTKLTLYPHKDLAETDQPVTITQPDTIVHGIGMQADLKKSTVKLISKTHGQYMRKPEDASQNK